MPDDLAKLTNVVKNETVKKTDFSSDDYVKKTKFSADTNALDDKIDKVNKKIHDVSDLASKSSATVLKGQSCKLYKNRYMIASTHITNTEIFAFVTVLVFTLLSRKILFINSKHNRNC